MSKLIFSLAEIVFILECLILCSETQSAMMPMDEEADNTTSLITEVSPLTQECQISIEAHLKPVIRIKKDKCSNVVLKCAGYVIDKCPIQKLSLSFKRNGVTLKTYNSKQEKYKFDKDVTDDECTNNNFSCIISNSFNSVTITYQIEIKDSKSAVLIRNDRDCVPGKVNLKPEKGYFHLISAGSNYKLTCRFYIPNTMKNYKFGWFRHLLPEFSFNHSQKANSTDYITENKTDDRCKCQNMPYKCISVELIFNKIQHKDDTHYSCVIYQEQKKSAKALSLINYPQKNIQVYHTYKLAVDGVSGYPFIPNIDFTLNSTVCLNRNFSLICAVNGKQTILKLYKMSYENTTTPISSLKINDDMLKEHTLLKTYDSRVDAGPAFLEYTLTNLSKVDMASYVCTCKSLSSFHGKSKQMFLKVEDCQNVMLIFGHKISRHTIYVLTGVTVKLFILILLLSCLLRLWKKRADRLKRIPVRKQVIIEYESPIYNSFQSCTKDFLTDVVHVDSLLPDTDPLVPPIIKIRPIKRRAKVQQHNHHYLMHKHQQKIRSISENPNYHQRKHLNSSSQLDNDVFITEHDPSLHHHNQSPNTPLTNTTCIYKRMVSSTTDSDVYNTLNNLELAPDIYNNSNLNIHSKPFRKSHTSSSFSMNGDSDYLGIYDFPYDPNWEFPRHNLKVGNKKLGEGAFGMVYEGCIVNKETGVNTKVAVKMMKDDFSDSNLRDFVQEMETMKHIGPHPNVIRLIGICTQKGPARMIVEFAPYGSLRDLLRLARSSKTTKRHRTSHSLGYRSPQTYKTITNTNTTLVNDTTFTPDPNHPSHQPYLVHNQYNYNNIHHNHPYQPPNKRKPCLSLSSANQNNKTNVYNYNIFGVYSNSGSMGRSQYGPPSETSLEFTPALLSLYSLQISQGMAYLASRSIVHRDLSARNILVGENYEMKIADFGLTRVVDYYYRKKTDGILPVKWMSPESLLEKKYTTKSDVWSYGILLWEIFSLGDSPYSSILPDQVIAVIRKGQQNPRPVLATDPIYALMQHCWSLEPELRPHFHQLVTEWRTILMDMSCQNGPSVATNTTNVDSSHSTDTTTTSEGVVNHTISGSSTSSVSSEGSKNAMFMGAKFPLAPPPLPSSNHYTTDSVTVYLEMDLDYLEPKTTNAPNI